MHVSKAIVLLAAVALVACTTLEVGVERTPTLDPARAEQATRVTALETRVAELAQAPAAAPTAEPTADIPTAAPEPAATQGVLAFVRGGDVWVQALPGDEPRRLTADGRSQRPDWSPSGEWLALRKGDGLWVMRADGSSARQIVGANPDHYAWAPGDDRLAYVHAEWGQLRLISPEALANTGDGGLGDGLFEEAPPDGEWYQLLTPVWRQDGAELAFAAVRRNGESGAVTFAGVLTVPAEPGASPELRYDLPEPRSDGIVLGGWTPDGGSLLLWRDPEFSGDYERWTLWALPLGGEPFQLPDMSLPYADFRSGAEGSGRLALTAGGGYTTWENKRLALLDGGEWRDLTDSETVAQSPAFAPDGARLAYVSRPAESDILDRRIWVMDVDDPGRARQITGDPAYRDERPRWSGDGGALLFARITRDGRASLWMVGEGGGAPWQIVDELTPAPEWYGSGGYIDWDLLFDWWTGAPSG